jgi:hypothetical protein
MTSRARVAFGHAFRIETPVPELTTYLEALFAGLPTDPGSGHLYSIVGPDADGAWAAQLDGETIEGPGDAPRAVALLLWRINRNVISAADGQLTLHAGGIVVDGTCVLLAGDMEVGKTTLTTGLLRAGAGYLSDEAIGLELEGDRAWGYAKALSIDPGSWPLFPELEPDPPAAVRPFLPDQWQIMPADVDGVEVVASAVPGLVVLPRYEPGAALRIERLRGASALQRLTACVFPTSMGRPAMLDRLARLIDTAHCYELRHADLDEAVDTVRRLAEGEELGAASLPPLGAAVATSSPAEPDAAAPTGNDGTSGGGTVDVDDRAAVRRRHDVHVVRVDGDAVAHVASTDELHLLSPLGSLVLERLGEAVRPVRDLAADMPRSGPDVDAVLVAARALVDAGLLEVVRLVDAAGS